MKSKLLFTFLLATFFSFSQASLVKDIEPGPASGNPQNLTIYGFSSQIVIFSAETGGEGIELWQSFGADVNTALILDINNTNPGISSHPENIILGNTGARYYFTADDGVNGNEIWIGGGPSGPNIHLDLYDGPQGSNVTEISSSDSFHRVFMVCNPFVGGSDYGTEIVSFPFNDVTEIASGSLNGDPENLYYDEASNLLYFSGNNQLGDGKELYSWDSGSSPVSMIANINPNGDSNPNHFINLNDKIYFSANGGSTGNELYELDYVNGNQVNLIKDIKTGIIGGDSSDPGEKIVFNNKIYFAARSTLQGRELWESDGTNAGTQLVFDLNPGTAGSFPENFTIYNNRLYFTATTPGLGLELFYVEAAGNIVLAKDVAPGNDGSNPQDLTIYNSKLYFSADDGANGIELWETDGTMVNTVMTANIHPSASSSPRDLVATNNLLFFSADDGVTGRELWKYQDPTLSVKSYDTDILTLFPNPTNQFFSIDNRQNVLKIDIYDLQGKIVKSFSTNQEYYDIEDLTFGVYFVKISTATGRITKKLIKH